ncbi:MAG: TetR family transcriptional regulator [Rhodospirillales bacterium]|nr:TetR family transcriptional regulator [Rhodospirillales bacterium]
MSDQELDRAVVSAVFRMAEERGWNRVSVPAAALAADLPLPQVRARFPTRLHVLHRFGTLLDQAALEGASADGSVRDRLFDLLMRRFDALQVERGGVLALLSALPFNPATSVLLSCETRRSMRWLLGAAGAGTGCLRGEARVQGLVAVWLWGMRAWQRDQTEDLSATMAAVDSALGRAEQAAGWLSGMRGPSDGATQDATGAETADAGVNAAAEDAPAMPTTPPATPPSGIGGPETSDESGAAPSPIG